MPSTTITCTFNRKLLSLRWLYCHCVSPAYIDIIRVYETSQGFIQDFRQGGCCAECEAEDNLWVKNEQTSDLGSFFY